MGLQFDIKFSDNVGDLKKHLAEGLNQIEVTKAGMDRLVKSIGGENVIRAAHNYAAALQKIGGEAGALGTIERLTSAERQRGIDLLQKAIDKYKLLGKEAPTALHDLLNAQKQVSASAGDLPKSVEQSGKGLTSLIGNARGLAAAFGVGFGVTQVVNFGKALIADADALVKMRDKTGISIQWLQRFQVAADDAGNTLDQITGAVNKMQDRLAGGDKSAAGALETLHLNLARLKQLSPEQQFVEIADAIRGVKDPAEQVNLAIDIFGKSGAELLPTIKRGFDDVKNAAVGMADESAEAIDHLGDVWAAFVRRVKGTSGDLFGGALKGIFAGQSQSTITPGGTDMPSGGFLTDYDRLTYEAAKATEAFNAEVNGLLKTLSGFEKFGTSARGDQGNLFGIKALDDATVEKEEARIRKQIEARQKAADALKKLREEQKRFDEQFARSTAAARGVEQQGYTSNFGFGGLLNVSALKLDTSIVDDYKALQANLKKIDEVEQRAIHTNFGYAGSMDQIAQKLGAADKVAPPLIGHVRGLNDALKSFKGGDFGAVFKDIGNFFKNGVGDIGRGFLEGIGRNLLGGVTGLLDKGVGLVGKGLGKLFDAINHTEGRKVNDLRDAFQASFGKNGVGGSLDDLVRGFGKVGLGIEKVQKLLKAGNEKEFKKIVDEFNAATSTQKTAFDFLNATVEKYHISIEDLGPAFRAQKLGEEAADLYKEFKILAGSGMDTATIFKYLSGVDIQFISREEYDRLDEAEQKLFTISDQGISRVRDWGNGFGQLVHDAMVTGTALPAYLKPVVQQMVDLGYITREDGTKFGSLEETGLTFTETLTEGMHDLVGSIDGLVQALRDGLGFGLTEVEQKARALKTALEEIPEGSGWFGSNDKRREKAQRDLDQFYKEHPDLDPDKAHSGALVLPGGLRKLHTGLAKVLPFPRFHMGIDEVPAILQVGEAVLNKRAVSNIGTDAIGALNHGFTPQAMVDVSELRATGTDGRRGDVYQISIHATDAPSFERLLAQGVKSRAFADALSTQVQWQKRGLNRKLSRGMK